MMTTPLAKSPEIDLNEQQAVGRLAALIRFLRGEISLTELRIRVAKELPMKLIKLCELDGYMPRLTQEGLGKKLGCTYAAVQTWEKGNKPSFPRLTTFIKIAICCNLNINELTDLLFDYSDEVISRDNFGTLALVCEGIAPAVPDDEFELLLD